MANQDKIDLFSGSRTYSRFADIGYTWARGIDNPEGTFVSPSYQDLSFAPLYSRPEYFSAGGVTPFSFFFYYNQFSENFDHDAISDRFDNVGMFKDGTYNISLSKASDLVMLDDGNDAIKVDAFYDWGGDDRVFGGRGVDTLYVEGDPEDITYKLGNAKGGFEVAVIEHIDFQDPIILIDFEYVQFADYSNTSKTVSFYLSADLPSTDSTSPVIMSLSTASAVAEDSGASQIVYNATTDDSSGVTFSLKANKSILNIPLCGRWLEVRAGIGPTLIQ